MPRQTGLNSPWRYALGMLALTLPSHFFNTFLTSYYNDTLGLPLASLAVATTLYALWDAVNDPLAGWLSDNTRTRWGRRKPWVIWGVPIYVIMMVLLFWADRYKGTPQLMWYYIAMTFLFEGVATILWTNYGVLFPEVFRDPARICRAAVWRQTLQIAGILIAALAAPVLAAKTDLRTAAAVFAALGGALLIYSVTGMREQTHIQAQQKTPILRSLRIALSHKPFVVMAAVGACTQLVSAIVMSSIPLYAKYALGLDQGKIAILQGAILIMVVPMAWLWGLVSKKVGVRRAWQYSVGAVAVCVLGFALARDLTGGIAAGALYGIGYAGILVNGDLFGTLIISRHTQQTGVNNEGVFGSVGGFFSRISGVLKGWSLALLTVLFGYASGDVPGPRPGDAWRFGMGVIPFVFAAAGFAVALYYTRVLKVYDGEDAQDGAPADI